MPPSRRVTWLQSIRILSRDRSCLDPFTGRQSLQALACYAGIAASESDPEPLDADVVLESLKCLCNLVLSSPAAQVLAAEARLVVRLAERVGPYRQSCFPHDIQFFDLRLLFLLTALRADVRQQLFAELQGVLLLTKTLELTLGAAPEESPPERLPPQETERAMEILKVLFNITFDSVTRDVDEVRLAGACGQGLTAWTSGPAGALDFLGVTCREDRRRQRNRCLLWPGTSGRFLREVEVLSGSCAWKGRAVWCSGSCGSPGGPPPGDHAEGHISKEEWSCCAVSVGNPGVGQAVGPQLAAATGRAPSQEPSFLWSGRHCPLPAPGNPSAALCDGHCCRRPHGGVPWVREPVARGSLARMSRPAQPCPALPMHQASP